MKAYSETARRLARRLVSARFYQRISILIDRVQIFCNFGASAYHNLLRGRVREAELRIIVLKGYAHPIAFRPSTPDVSSIIQTIVREEYYQTSLDEASVELIVDAGSYIGDTTLFFLNKYPNSRVIALEPNPESYRIAEVNLRPYGGRVTLLPKGLWKADARLLVGGSYIGSSVTEASAGQTEAIDGISVPSLMTLCEIGNIDLLKMDIEGAEGEVLLTNSESWLPRIRALIVEFHSVETEVRVRALLASRGFREHRFRSVWGFENRLHPALSR